MKEEGKEKRPPKTVQRPAVPADYLKARPKVYLNSLSEKRSAKLPNPSTTTQQITAVTQEADETATPISARKAKKIAKKAERKALEHKLRSELGFGEDEVAPSIKDESDIGKVWKEQEQIRTADKNLEIEYKANKERTKLLKKKIKELNSEGDNLNLKGILGPDGYEKVITAQKETKKVFRYTAKKLKPVIKKATIVAATPVKERKKVLGFIKKSRPTKKKALLMTLGLTAIIVGGVVIQKHDNKQKVANSSSGTIVEGAVDEKPSFTILYPTSKDKNTLKTVKVSPSESAPSYAFTDTIGDGARIIVTQQELPDSFKSDPGGELKKLATSFQATDVIQVDQTTIYSGLNQKSGVQSLLMVKNNLLVFLRSDKKLSDDAWAGYIASLK